MTSTRTCVHMTLTYIVIYRIIFDTLWVSEMSSKIYTCSRCKAAFPSVSRLNNHRKSCLDDVVTTRFGGKSITLTKNADGRFSCYCSHNGCPSPSTTYKTIENLKRHLGKVGSEWVGPNKVKLYHTFQPSSRTDAKLSTRSQWTQALQRLSHQTLMTGPLPKKNSIFAHPLRHVRQTLKIHLQILLSIELGNSYITAVEL
jgi:hypothetical protein